MEKYCFSAHTTGEINNLFKSYKDNFLSKSNYLTNKVDLKDFTFLIPIRIDSIFRLENVNTIIQFIQNHFDTNLIVLEGDKYRRYFPNFKLKTFQYQFLKDSNPFFYKTKIISLLMKMANTPFLAVWDSDAIVPLCQIIKSVKILRKNHSAFCIPYDGRTFVCDKYLSYLFKNILDIEILLKFSSRLPLMYGNRSTGGAFMVNKDIYLNTGGENINFYGWGPEDIERVIRAELLNFSIYFSSGALFHLWHPRGKTSWYYNARLEYQNLHEFLYTCKCDAND